MSNIALNHVWKYSKQSGGALVVMLAIADMANDEGDCWPGKTNLAKKCHMSERNLQRTLARLRDVGELMIFYNDGAVTGTGKTNRYHIILQGETSTSPLNGSRGDAHAAPGVTPMPPLNGSRGDAHAAPGVTPMPPDPSLEPSEDNDPSLEPSEGNEDIFEYSALIAADKQPPPPGLSHIAIIDAWYDGMPAPPISRKYPRNVRTAKRILEAGFTPEQVKACTQAKYAKTKNPDSLIKLEWIEEDLPLWVKALGGNPRTEAYWLGEYAVIINREIGPEIERTD